MTKEKLEKKRKNGNSTKQEIPVISKKKEVDEEPSWYHYLIVLLVFFGFFGGVYFFFFDSQDQVNTQIKKNSYVYEHVVGNKTYNIQFENSLYDLDQFNMTDELILENLLNSKNVFFSFDKYNGTDNKYVSTTSVKIMKLFKYLYGFEMGTDSILDYNNYTCVNSTIENKIITFNPYSNKEGVYYNESNGCIQIESTRPEDFIKVGDKFIYTLISEE